MKSSAPILVALFGSVVGMRDAGAQPLGQRLAGTWSVTTTATAENTCGQADGSTTANVWLLSYDAAGQISVEVQGGSRFRRLSGQISGSTVSVMGLGDGTGSAIFGGGRVVAWLTLTLQGGALVGTQRVLSTTRLASHPQEWVPCYTDYAVRARRM